LILTGLASCTQLRPANQNIPAPQPSVSHFPIRNGLVNDYAGVLDAEAESRITELLKSSQATTEIETVIAIVSSTNGKSPFDYSLQLAREWKIGPNGRGVLFLVAVDDRHWRIQVSRSLESVLTDEVCKEMGDNAAQFFKTKNYSQGLERFITELDARVRNTHISQIAQICLICG
jgi:uncharacterized protein